MKKISIIICVLLMFAFSGCGNKENAIEKTTEVYTTQTETTAESTTSSIMIFYVVNCNESITLRLSDDVNAAEITQIPFGEAVVFLEEAKNGFYKVKYQDKEGYVLSKYLSATKKEKETTTYLDVSNYQTYYVVNCKKSITLRESPSVSAKEILQIPLGAEVKFIEVSENGFYKIIYKNQVGYSLSNYLSESKSYNQNYNYMIVINCEKCITLRSAPSTSASKICDIDLGEYVEFEREAENGFYQIRYNGKVGYALSSYLAWD